MAQNGQGNVKFNWPKFNRYKVADPGYKIVLNDYDYRPNGGSRYIIGIAVVLGQYCYGVRWARPGNNFGDRGEAMEYLKILHNQNAEIHDLLADALGYPLYAPGEPGYNEAKPEYVTGDHTTMSLVTEAAALIKRIKNETQS